VGVKGLNCYFGRQNQDNQSPEQTNVIRYDRGVNVDSKAEYSP